jgi:hypothetical protein
MQFERTVQIRLVGVVSKILEVPWNDSVLGRARCLFFSNLFFIDASSSPHYRSVKVNRQSRNRENAPFSFVPTPITKSNSKIQFQNSKRNDLLKTVLLSRTFGFLPFLWFVRGKDHCSAFQFT